MAKMRTALVVASLLWLFAAAQISSAHDQFSVKPEKGMDQSVLAEILQSAFEKFLSQREVNGYFPRKEELLKIAELMSRLVESSSAGLSFTLRSDRKTDPIFYFLISESGIYWSFEQRVEADPENGFIYFRWKFRPDAAFFTMAISSNGGTSQDVFYDKEISTDSPDAVENSRYVLETLASYKFNR